MIEIPDPPTVAACTTCMSPISWCWSARNSSWFSVVRAGEDTMRIHDCNLPGAPPAVSWRETRRGSPPNDVYLAAKAALQEHTEEETT